jgi:hypothetical protein
MSFTSDNIDNTSEAFSFLLLTSTYFKLSNEKIKAPSDVWDYFQKIYDENNILKLYKYNLCNITYSSACVTSILHHCQSEIHS